MLASELRDRHTSAWSCCKEVHKIGGIGTNYATALETSQRIAISQPNHMPSSMPSSPSLTVSHFTTCASFPPSPALPSPATHSRYLKTSPFPFRPPPLRPLPNARRPTQPSRTAFTSFSLKGFSPASGLVCSRASRKSATSIWPESSSSKASKAARSSEGGESGTRRFDRLDK